MSTQHTYREKFEARAWDGGSPAGEVEILRTITDRAKSGTGRRP